MSQLWPLIDPATWTGLLLLLAAAVPWLRRRPALERLLAALPLLLFALLTMPPLAEWSMRRLALPESASAASPGAADLLVVLGGGMDDHGELSGSSYLRTAAAIPMWRQGVAPRILFSGVEAPRMAELARQLGLPDGVARLEPSSNSTRENAEQCRRLLTAGGQELPRLALVTSPAHLRRALRAFRAVGFTVAPAPAPYPLRPEPPAWHPTFVRAATTAQVVYEEVALLAYGWRGWLAD